jgi:[ribosomal protein S18]-alanine N-acetyltransferase
MSYQFRPLRWRDVRAAARWRYEGQYAFYDLPGGVLAMTYLTQQVLRLFGVIVYYAVLDEDGRLVGMFSFVRRDLEVEIGLAMRPDLTGRGRGLEFVRAGLDFARKRLGADAYRLNVARFNQRAIRVYERAGFRTVRTFTHIARGKPYEFLEMALRAREVYEGN